MGSGPAGFPHADCGSLGVWLTSYSPLFPPLNGLKVTGNQKEMKRVAPLKQLRLKEGRKKKVKYKSNLVVKGHPSFTSLRSLDPLPPTLHRSELKTHWCFGYRASAHYL